MKTQSTFGLLQSFSVAGRELPQIQQRLRALGCRLSNPTVHFWLCWVLVIGGIAYRYPSLGFQAEMFAENGTNLFYHAKYSGFWANLLELEYYEYLVWLPRLIALIAVKGFHLRESYAFVTEWSGHVLTGFFYAFFCLKRFRLILPSDLARFLVATALGIGLLGTYELYAFINFPYHGMFLMLILLFSSLDSRPWSEVIGLTVLVFLVGTSKVYPVAFLPFYAVATLLARTRSQVHAQPLRSPGVRLSPQTAFLGVTVLSLLLQAGATLVATTLTRTDVHDLTASPATTLGETPVYFIRAWLHLLFPTDFLKQVSTGLSWLVPWILLSLFGLLGTLCVVHWKRGNRRVVAFFLVCNGLALLNMAVTVYSLLPILRENELGKWILPFQNRWFYLSLTAVFLSTLIVVANLFRHHLIQAVLALALIVFVIGIKRDVLAEYHHYITTPEESFSQWSVYAPLTEQPDYAIPLNPHPWMLFHQTVELGDVESENGAFVLETSEPPLVRSAVVLESSSELEKAYELIAIDRNGNELATARQLIPAGYEHPYFYFERGVRTARFKLVDDASQPLAGSLTIRFMGPADPP